MMTHFVFNVRACSFLGNLIYLVEHSCANHSCLPDFSVNTVEKEQLCFHGVLLFVVKQQLIVHQISRLFSVGKHSLTFLSLALPISHQNYWTFSKSWISN